MQWTSHWFFASWGYSLLNLFWRSLLDHSQMGWLYLDEIMCFFFMKHAKAGCIFLLSKFQNFHNAGTLCNRNWTTGPAPLEFSQIVTPRYLIWTLECSGSPYISVYILIQYNFCRHWPHCACRANKAHHCIKAKRSQIWWACTQYTIMVYTTTLTRPVSLTHYCRPAGYHRTHIRPVARVRGHTPARTSSYLHHLANRQSLI